MPEEGSVAYIWNLTSDHRSDITTRASSDRPSASRRIWSCGSPWLTVCRKQWLLSSSAYSTPSLMNTDMARRMKETNRFMWMKFRVQCSFLWRDMDVRGALAKERQFEPHEAFLYPGSYKGDADTTLSENLRHSKEMMFKWSSYWGKTMMRIMSVKVSAYPIQNLP